MKDIVLKLNKFRLFIAFILPSTLLNCHILANTNSNDIPHYQHQHTCKVSKAVINNYEPQTFNITNNLLRRSGQKNHISNGIVIIKGTLLDKNCVPVFNAKVFLWQVDNNGKYPYIPLRNVVDHSLIATTHQQQQPSRSTEMTGDITTEESIDTQINYKPDFLGSGITTTDNNGNFCFITIYPVAVHDLSPHFNFRIEHQELGTFQTRYTIGDVEMSNDISKLLYVNLQNKEIVNSYPEEYITIVMPKASKIKRY